MKSKSFRTKDIFGRKAARARKFHDTVVAIEAGLIRLEYQDVNFEVYPGGVISTDIPVQAGKDNGPQPLEIEITTNHIRFPLDFNNDIYFAEEFKARIGGRGVKKALRKLEKLAATKSHRI